MRFNSGLKGLKAKLNPICYMLALLGAHSIFHVSVLRVKKRVELGSHTLSIDAHFSMERFSTTISQFKIVSLTLLQPLKVCKNSFSYTLLSFWRLRWKCFFLK
jgi:hypothetical protein